MTATPNKDTTMSHTPADIELPALPDNITSTAPERIWLDIGDAKDFIEPDDTFTTLMLGEATWSEDNATGCGIEYVRADRARTAASCAGWLPIETAPEDSRIHDVWLHEAGRVFRGFWVEIPFKELRDADGCYIDQQDPDAFWMDSDGGARCEPTEWFPIIEPAAPGAPSTVRAERTDAASVADTLERFNRWRRDGDDVIAQPHPSAISEALGKAVAMLREPGVAAAEPAPVVQPVAADLLEKALRRAYSLGQTYWQQADSDSFSQHRKSDETWAKFEALVAETVAAVDAASAVPAPTAGDAGGDAELPAIVAALASAMARANRMGISSTGAIRIITEYEAVSHAVRTTQQGTQQ